MTQTTALDPNAVPQADVPAAPTRRIDISWMITTVLLAAMSLSFAIIHLRHWLETGRLAGLAFAVMELVLVGVFIARRRPLVTSRRPIDWVAALVGGYAALLFRPADHVVLGLGAVWAAAEALAMISAAACIFRLGRSFGVVAANRGVKVKGPYRLLRHPMYACYVLAQLAYLLGSLSAVNAAILVVAVGGQVARIRSEERLLCADPTYRAYCERVRYRLIPRIY